MAKQVVEAQMGRSLCGERHGMGLLAVEALQRQAYAGIGQTSNVEMVAFCDIGRSGLKRLPGVWSKKPGVSGLCSTS